MLSKTLTEGLERYAGRGAGAQAGDSLYFDADRRHSYRRTGSKPCAAVVVTAPAGGLPTRGAAAPSSANCA